MASTVWRGYISFGLISIPVRLFRAARAERVSFRRLYREDTAATQLQPAPRRLELARRAEAPAELPVKPGISRRIEPILSPVQQVSVRKGTDEVLSEAGVVKGYEYEKNRFVVVESEELKSITPKTSAGMEIQEFVQLAEIDPVYFETSYYVTPEEGAKRPMPFFSARCN